MDTEMAAAECKFAWGALKGFAWYSEYNGNNADYGDRIADLMTRVQRLQRRGVFKPRRRGR